MHFSKQWASKAFFMLLVRCGTGDIGIIIRDFDKLEKSPEYRDMETANGQKSEEVLPLKYKLDPLRTRRRDSAKTSNDTVRPKNGMKHWAVVEPVWQKLLG